MKMKLKLDPEAAKQLVVDHFEKFVFGLVVLLFLGLVMSAVGRERLDFGPDKLITEAQAAKRHLDEPRTVSVAIPDFANQADRIREQVPEKPYRPTKDLNGPVVERKQKRPVPPVNVVQGLRGSAGQGAFAMTSEEEAAEIGAVVGGGTQVRGQRWVVVTGKIPHAKQVDDFTQAFENTTLRTQADYPDYIYARVQRAEVSAEQGDTVDPSELNWENINVNRALMVMDLWGGTVQEVGDPQFLPQRETICFPLGPLHDRPWGREVVYQPDIPLMADTMPETMMMAGGDMPGAARKKKADKTAEEAAEPGDEAESAPRPRKRPRRAAMPQDVPDDPMDMMGGGAGGYGEGPGMGSSRPRMMSPGMTSGPMGSPGMSMPSRSRGPGPGMSSSPYRAPGPGPGMRPTMTSGPSRMPGYGSMGEGYADEEFEEPKFMLYRFFDYNVQPGKHYRYRVRLVLANPNFGLPAQSLQDEGQAKKRWLEDLNGWSAPTTSVAVPLDSQVLAVSTKDKEAEVILINFSQEDGMVAHEQRSIPRGQWLNFADVPFTPPWAASGMGGYGSGPGMSSPAGPGMMPSATGMGARGEEAEEIKVNYRTNCLLLDVSGGGKLPGKEKDRLVEPANLLLMDPNGHLVIRNELDDLSEVQRFAAADAEAEPTIGASMPMASEGPGPGMPGGPYSGRRGGKSTGTMSSPYGSSPYSGKGSRSGSKGSSPMGMPAMSSPTMGPGMGTDMLDDRPRKKRR